MIRNLFGCLGGIFKPSSPTWSSVKSVNYLRKKKRRPRCKKSHKLQKLSPKRLRRKRLRSQKLPKTSLRRQNSKKWLQLNLRKKKKKFRNSLLPNKPLLPLRQKNSQQNLSKEKAITSLMFSHSKWISRVLMNSLSSR